MSAKILTAIFLLSILVSNASAKEKPKTPDDAKNTNFSINELKKLALESVVPDTYKYHENIEIFGDGSRQKDAFRLNAPQTPTLPKNPKH